MFGADGGGIMGLIPLIAFFAIFYFLLIRPQQKQAKKHKEMIANLKKGDKVITAGGFHATVMHVDEDSAKVRLAEGTLATIEKESIAKMQPEEEPEDDDDDDDDDEVENDSKK